MERNNDFIESYQYNNNTTTEVTIFGSPGSFLEGARFINQDEERTWEEMALVILLCFIIVITVIGNTLIITSG